MSRISGSMDDVISAHYGPRGRVGRAYCAPQTSYNYAGFQGKEGRGREGKEMVRGDRGSGVEGVDIAWPPTFSLV